MSRAILWDMDGTLIDSEPAHAAAFEDVVRELGISLPSTFHGQFVGSSAEVVHAAVVRFSGYEISFEDWKLMKWKSYEKHTTNLLRRDELTNVAQTLAKMGVPMAVVSNSTRQEVEHCLRVSQIDKFISISVSRDEVEFGKPHPDSYLLGASLLKVDPKNCLVVEDSVRGAEAGVKAKMTVLFHPQHKFVDTNLIPEGSSFIPYNQDARVFIDKFLND